MLANAGLEAELAPNGGICTGPAPSGPVAYDDLFYVLSEGARYAGDVRHLEGGEFLVLRYEGSLGNLAYAHAALTAAAREMGLRDDLPRYEVSSFKLFDDEEGLYLLLAVNNERISANR